MQSNQNISANRVNVTVGGQVFSIPANKVGELQGILSAWQSIAVTEGNNGAPPPKWNGQSLING